MTAVILGGRIKFLQLLDIAVNFKNKTQEHWENWM